MRTRHFYDQLAERYDLLYPDWNASVTRQGQALAAVIEHYLGPDSRAILDCACGIGTQAVGLAGQGHRVVGADLSPQSVTRAVREARARRLSLPAIAADMRALPFRNGSFDVIICADNALPHLLTSADLNAALADMRRLLRPGGLLLASTRPYDSIRQAHPRSTLPQITDAPDGRALTFQLWDWHPDAEHYDLELFQLIPNNGSWSVNVLRAAYWALTRDQIMSYVTGAGFCDAAWHAPEETGFFQPLLTARVPG
jgi:SAM-dependent methyltransferase